MTMKELLDYTDDWKDYRGRVLVQDLIRFKEMEERYLTMKNQVANRVNYYSKLNLDERAEFSKLNPSYIVFLVRAEQNTSFTSVDIIAEDKAHSRAKYIPGLHTYWLRRPEVIPTDTGFLYKYTMDLIYKEEK